MPTSKDMVPNPFLDDPLRDLVTDKGISLTKINPAFMTRQIAEIEAGLLPGEIEKHPRHLVLVDSLEGEDAPGIRERRDQVEPAVAVVVEEDRARGVADVAEPRLLGDVLELPLAVVLEQGVAHADRGDVEVLVAVVVEVGEPDAVPLLQVADAALLAKVETWMGDALLYAVERYREEVRHLIAHTVSQWDAGATSRKVEQQIRAEILTARGLARWVHPKELNEKNLAEALEWALRRDRMAHAQLVRDVIPSFDGVARLTKYLSRWLEPDADPAVAPATVAAADLPEAGRSVMTV